MKIKFIAAAMIGTLVVSCESKQEQNVVAPVNVKIETAGSAANTSNRSYVGEVEAGSSTAVSSLAPGTVTKVLVEEGQHVSEGQVVAIIDPTQARNTLESARAVLRQADDAYKRMKVLHDKKAVSEMDFVSVESKLQQAKSAVSMANKAVEDCNLKAPCSGVIGKKYVESGMTVLPSQPICNILNVGVLKVKISVPEKEVGLFSANTRTKISVAALNQTFNGGRVEVGVEGSSVSRTYDVFVHIANGGGKLRPGMVCDVVLDGVPASVGASSSVVKLPITAVHRRASGDMFVWKLENGKAKRVKVTPGASAGDRIEIAEGVASGDQIIVEGHQKLSEGSEVNVKKD